jgi:hypothetical protein
LSFARDVEGAIREHDYLSAMEHLKSGLSSPREVRGLNDSSWDLLLRPSVTIAAALVNDHQAHSMLERAIRGLAESYHHKPTLIEKVAVSRTDFEMALWVIDATQSHTGDGAKEIIQLARQNGFTKNVSHALKMLERHGVIHIVDGTIRSGAKETAPSSVPEFKGYFSVRNDMDAEQTCFYEGSFKPVFLEGEYVDLEENHSYVFVLLAEVASVSNLGSLDQLRDVFLRAARLYPDTPIVDHALRWAADTHFLQGAFQAGFDLLAGCGLLDLETYIGIADKLEDSRVTGDMAWRWVTGKKVTQYGQGLKRVILDELERMLDEEHGKRGQSIVVELWHGIAVERAPDAPAPAWVEEMLDGVMGPGQLARSLYIMSLYGGRGRASFRTLAADRDPSIASITWPSRAAAGFTTHSSYGFSTVIEAYLRKLFREAENRARTAAGVPKVGEGWVSEVDLYYGLRASIAETRVVHQGRPSWLGRQSVDIYFPDWGVAVEYQGEQHVRPVERFGGQAAFEIQQERDSRKRDLCAENMVTLVEVFPGYDLAEVISQIRSSRRR